jgi:hypothetical protein
MSKLYLTGRVSGWQKPPKSGGKTLFLAGLRDRWLNSTRNKKEKKRREWRKESSEGGKRQLTAEFRFF